MLNKLIKMRNKKGFTLIELIVVLVIMAILAAFAIPTMMGAVEDARKSSYLANCRAAYVAGQAGITAQLDKDVITTTDLETYINGMVPELSGKVKVFVTGGTAVTRADDNYVVTINTTDTAASAKAKVVSVDYYKKAADATAYTTLTPANG